MEAYIKKDNNGDEIVVIDCIIFKGRQGIKWKEVEAYLEQYVDKQYEITFTGDIVCIGNDFPDEFAGSKYTYKLKGAVAKAKANASQGIPQLLSIARGKHFRENSGDKHRDEARYGWYRYDSRFALPVYDMNDEVDHYNAFHASLLVRHDLDKQLYLYDVIDIKKKRVTRSSPKTLLGTKLISFI